MKFIITLSLSVFCCFCTIAQEKEAPERSLLEAPEDWRKELLQLPLGFAPELNYKGIEDVRFSKGWGNKDSEEFFTYTFAWYLDIDPELSSEKLNKELKIYFDGLMNAIGQGRNIPKEKITPTQASLIDDSKSNSFKGEVKIFDVFFTQEVITLNVKVSTSYCKPAKKHIAYFEFSPQGFDHKLWDTMNKIRIPCN
ncbi:hypothetical protein GTQ40_16595 [Flavobacteriaceae bacterium R38]|nr:hypothetical protein [Flavobacteriaceae bacterium R38]